MFAADQQPDLESGIYRVTHTLLVEGALVTCVSDLIFQNEDAFAVLEWTEGPGETWPKVKVLLDPSRLQPTLPRGWFLYTGELTDPRP